MSYRLVRNNGTISYDIQEYYCDTPADILNLPKNIALGSLAFIISTGDIYFINSNREWVKT